MDEIDAGAGMHHIAGASCPSHAGGTSVCQHPVFSSVMVVGLRDLLPGRPLAYA